MPDLTGAQKESLIDALLSGYTSDEQLAALLDLRLGVKLAEIAQDGTLRNQVFEVVTWAEANGRTKDLAREAQARRPKNAKLAAFVDSLYPGERLPAADEWGDGDSTAGGVTERRAPNRSKLIVGAVAVLAILIAAVAFVFRSRAGDDDNGGKGRQRPPATLRFTTLSATATPTPPRVVVEARFPPPQLSPGAVLWFAVGSGQRCRQRLDRAQVDHPALGYMTFVLSVERERVTCAQLFVEDANGQTIARSEPHDITYQGSRRE